MSTSTSGLQVKTRHRALADAIELLSSMRFAISLLSLIAVASVIGTVLKQNEPMVNYVSQFGPFWFDVFGKFSLYNLYSAWWFLLIMAFLVTSTSLCIVRNTPRMLKDMRSWRDNVREQALRNFHHKAEWSSALEQGALVQQLADTVAGSGYKVKVAAKENAALIAARKGVGNKWGYILAHSAIVIICLGGLLDSDLSIRAQQLFLGKTPFSGSGMIADVPAQHRLGTGNMSFRGNTLIPEGAASNTAIISQKDGVLIQELPFTIELKKFIIDFYATGMPKLFASEVVVTDNESGKRFPATIKVNQPLVYKGIAVYQSSFEDGGSKLKLAGYPMRGAGSERFGLSGEVGGSTPLDRPGAQYMVEWSGFRPFNVENMAQAGQDVRAVNPNQGIGDSLAKQLGSAAKNEKNKDLKNVGPSVQYKLRDATGQAREFLNYMLPVDMDGASVFLAGVRDTPSDPFRYLRIPADDKDSVEEWMRLRAAIANPQMRRAAVQRYTQRAMPAGTGAANPGRLQAQLRESAQKTLDIFAGDDKSAGYFAVSRFLENIPASEQEKAADVFFKILNGCLWDVWQLAREQAGLPAVANDEKHARFLQMAALAYSDAAFYKAPVYLQLQEFDEVKATVLQVTRSPGKGIVYLGCLFLVLGVFAMLYIRERRLWIWVKPAETGGSHALMALSTQRRTLDFEREFEALRQKLVPPAPAGGNEPHL